MQTELRADEEISQQAMFYINKHSIYVTLANAQGLLKTFLW